MLIFLAVPDWVFWVGGTVVVIAIWMAIAAAFARKRTQALSATALQIGFTFEGNKWSDPGQSPQLKTTLFGKGSARTFRNIMTGSSSGLRVSLFDYSYVVGSGRNSHTYAQTVASFIKAGGALPEFEMEPKGILGKIGDALLHKNINFESHPEFSRRYQLRSPEQDRTRALFTPALLSFLESLDPKKNWSLEGLGETLIIYRSGKRTKPEELRTFLEETTTLGGSFLRLGGVGNI